MLIDQSAATLLPGASTETLERRASRLTRLANERPADTHEFARALLAEYILHRRGHRREQFSGIPDHISISAWFDLHPFELSGMQGAKGVKNNGSMLRVDDRQALLPLRFRDALANTLLVPIEIGQISFGCLRVDYFVSDKADLALLDPSEIAENAAFFALTKLEVGGGSYYQAR